MVLDKKMLINFLIMFGTPVEKTKNLDEASLIEQLEFQTRAMKVAAKARFIVFDKIHAMVLNLRKENTYEKNSNNHTDSD